MRIISYFICLLILFFPAGCDREEFHPEDSGETNARQDGNIPEGYFVVDFSSGFSNPETKAAITGEDDRISHLRYIIYKSTGEFVKEHIILTLEDDIPSWPMVHIRDTLPRDSYRAVFLGNVEKTLFPYPTSSSPVNYSDVLIDYTTSYTDARIVLPNAPFSSTTEYYWANVPFSDQDPEPYVLLQRIITSLKVHRNFIDAQDALNNLVANIVAQMQYRDIIATTVETILPGLLLQTLQGIPLLGTLLYLVTGGLDGLVNILLNALLEPVTNALYELLLKELVNQIGMTLVGNNDEEALLLYLEEILNPWADAQANTAIVSKSDFPKSIDFDLTTRSIYNGIVDFGYDFQNPDSYQEKSILIKGFDLPYDITNINAIRSGLVSGLVVDFVVDDLLLPGAFIDIKDELNAIEGNTLLNRRFQADYSFLDLKLNETGANGTITLSVRIGDIANIDGIIGGLPLAGTILNLILSPVKNIQVSVNLGLPILALGNLELNGRWSEISTY